LAFIGIIGSIGLLPFIIKDFSLLNQSNTLFLLTLGVVTFIMAMFDFEALKKGKLSIINVVMETELPVTIALGFIFFAETLSFLQSIIIAFIFIGIVLIATKSFSHWKRTLEKGVLIALVAAGLMGVVNFLTAASAKTISPLLAIWFPWVVFTIMCLFYIWRKEGTLRFIKDAKKFKLLVLLMGIFDTAAWIFYAFAVMESSISIITAITESYPAIAIFLGFYFNKEKINWHQWVGAGIALSASFILGVLI